MATEQQRVFNILETCCFPHGCLIPEDHQLRLATVLIPQLEQAGMTVAEWTRGAEIFEEPYFSKVKAVVCKQCNIRECPLNPHFRSSDGLFDLKDGQYPDRVKRGEELLAQLFSAAKKSDLEQRGIQCTAFQMPSRKNPKLLFAFTFGGKTRRVSCEVGTRRLSTDQGEEALLSLKQLGQKIDEAILALI